MKLSDLKNEDAIEALAEIIDPVSEILADQQMIKLVNANAKKIAIVKVILKNHSKQIIQILARLDGKTPETYEANILTLPAKLLELFNDPAVADLFLSQGQTVTSSGSATVNTEVKEN